MTSANLAPNLALSLAYWLHMLATVTWIGSLAALALLVLPAARRSLTGPAYAAFLITLQRRLDPLGWLSLLALTGTGLFQMSASPHYAGFLSIANPWAAAILIKHLVFLAMTATSASITWGLMPRLGRLALLQAHGQETPEAPRLLRQEVLLLRLNLFLGVIVLALTALARAA
jgi:uncharacterized membrane protein